MSELRTELKNAIRTLTARSAQSHNNGIEAMHASQAVLNLSQALDTVSTIEINERERSKPNEHVRNAPQSNGIVSEVMGKKSHGEVFFEMFGDCFVEGDGVWSNCSKYEQEYFEELANKFLKAVS